AASLPGLPERARRGRVHAEVVTEHHAVLLARGRLGHEFLEHVPADALRVALQRIAPAASAAGAHDDLGVLGHRLVAAVHHPVLAAPGAAQIVAAAFAGLAAPQAPRGTAPA